MRASETQFSGPCGSSVDFVNKRGEFVGARALPSVRHRPACGNGRRVVRLERTGFASKRQRFTSPINTASSGQSQPMARLWQPNQNIEHGASNRLVGVAQTQTWRESKKRARKRKELGGVQEEANQGGRRTMVRILNSKTKRRGPLHFRCASFRGKETERIF